MKKCFFGINMKHMYIIFTLSISFAGLNSMSEEERHQKELKESLNLRPFFDAPYIAKWQKICKDPQETRNLVNVYQDFCGKRIKNNIAWTAGSLIPVAPYVFKFVRQEATKHPVIAFAIVYCWFPLRQTYLLGRNCYRADLASRGNLYYLNNDIWEQLGYPEVYKRDIYPKNHWYGIGDPYRETKYRINNVSDIERALSGKHPELGESQK
jgi:hypothetical protein